jgi:hypothetical protein
MCYGHEPECTASPGRCLERWKPRKRGSLPGWDTLSTARHPGTIPPWRATRDPHECSREVWMVSKASLLRDGCNRFIPTSERCACPCDPTPSQVLTHRAVKSPPEQFGQIHGVDAGDACHTCKPVDLHQVRVEIGDAPVEALVRLEQTAHVCTPSRFA